MTVYNIYLTLVDEASGKPMSIKMTRIFDTDLRAGKHLLDRKVDEIWKDLFHVMPVAGTA